MAYKVIPIPGNKTTLVSKPRVQIVGSTDDPISLVIRYNFEGIVGEIIFINVLEYRWISDLIEYYPYNDSDNFEFGLIQINKSKYIEDIASKGRWKDSPGKRFGLYIDESSVKHFRIVFDDYGQFDIIALDVSVNEVAEEQKPGTEL